MVAETLLGAAGAALALWGAAGLAARARARRAEAEAPPLGRMLDVAGARIHAWEAGEGPPVVLLHGASGNLRDFTFDLAPRLARRFRIIAFDRPGLGHSGQLPGYGPHRLAGESPPEQARTLAAAARSLGVERPIVLGHSYGGAVALAWALEAEAAGLVLLGAVSNPWPGGLGLAYHLPASRLGALLAVPPIAAALPRGRLEEMVSRTFTPNRAPPGYAAYLGAGLALRPRALVANARQLTSLYPHVVAMAQRYAAEISCPVEILHGAEDRIVPPEIHAKPLAGQIAGARLTLLPDTGHMPHHAAPRRTEAAVLRVARAAGLRPGPLPPIVSRPIRRAPDTKVERP